MAALRDIKRRLRATKNMQQITHAMEAVSASKMRRSQGVARAARLYSIKALEILGNIGETIGRHHPLFRENPTEKIGLLLVTSDKGLCGGYNANVLKLALRFLGDKRDTETVVVGKKAVRFLERRNIAITGRFSDFGDYIEVEETSPVARLLLDRYQKGTYKEVWVAYTNFVSTLKQRAVLRRILPIDVTCIREVIDGALPKEGKYSELRKEWTEGRVAREYLFEPNREELFLSLLPSLFEVAIHHIILESNASEHSARMVAMKNASENAGEIIQELNLAYNKARQAGITKELLEIVAGKEALENA